MPALNFNFFRGVVFPFYPSALDIILFVVWLVFLRQERLVGGVRSALTLLKIFSAFLMSLILYPYLSKIGVQLGIYKGTSDAISMVILAGITLVILQQLTNRLVIENEGDDVITHFFPYLTGSLTFLLVVTWFISITLSFPSSLSVKNIITRSFVGTYVQSTLTLLDVHIQQLLGDQRPLSINDEQVTSLSDHSYNLNFQVRQVSEKYTVAQALLNQLNQMRQTRKLTPLEQNADLVSVAFVQAKDVAQTGHLATSSSAGYTVYDRLSMMNIPYTAASEIVIHASSVASAVISLQSISDSQQIIFNPAYSSVGVSVVEADSFGEIFVLDFLQP